ncbi:hypothetical protein M1O55_03340 [Dehalococcoidia bacterium]|nr:hypothetical protein [Dehalococcoidia bacterium]
MSYSIQEKAGIQSFYHYSNMAENLVDSSRVPLDTFYSDGICHRQINPYNCDQARGFLHTNDWDVKRRFMQEMYGGELSELQDFWQE